MGKNRTTFILHGGVNSEKGGEGNTAFYSAILKDAPTNARILLVPFAKDSDRVLAAIEKVTAEFSRTKGDKEITIDVANEERFVDQMATADIAYFHGGVSLKLLEALKKYPDLERHLSGKTIAGESAGANVWCRYFYSPHADDVFEGLGILPFKIIPHYTEEYKGKLNDIGSNEEELLLPEHEFKVFQK